ncbi:hypothetical protein [Microbacterium elymi]|uniref:Peptidase S9 prolyl oligopeptidase catalytic domain-containing protein n=1 Tax=Microbacterium elymi TaxID=2909587 RepID=A0ABY5NIL3_9MICO|nr:hypothetical protein [Microbacterium elymi]UUT35005.1 hypothetical protein L2X98_32205 [Microbacterium elymi]
MDVPLLALFGEDDDVVPVARSAEILRTVVRPDLLDLHVLPRGDHRLQHGEDFVPDYLETLTRFLAAQMDAAG